MKLTHSDKADIMLTAGETLESALGKTTHLGIGAHQDDLEIMALDGILGCYGKKDLHFSGITCTDGAGSARVGHYASFSDEDMKAVRIQEQRKAAMVGDYACMLQLGFSSAEVKSPEDDGLVQDLVQVLQLTRPKVLYTHNPADKHPTHIGVMSKVIQAIRHLPKDQRPKRVLGCEVWRDLDWVLDEEKVAMDISDREGLANALIGIFDSQVAGGKRYDLASSGRRRANATYFSSHTADDSDGLWFALDLTPLVENDSLDITEYVMGFVNRFADSVAAQLNKLKGA